MPIPILQPQLHSLFPTTNNIIAHTIALHFGGTRSSPFRPLHNTDRKSTQRSPDIETLSMAYVSAYSHMLHPCPIGSPYYDNAFGQALSPEVDSRPANRAASVIGHTSSLCNHLNCSILSVCLGVLISGTIGYNLLHSSAAAPRSFRGN